jgi:hypothetical protein
VPALVAGAIASAAGVATTATFVAGALTTYGAITLATQAAFLVGGAALARRASRKAQRQADASIQDRRYTVRGSAEPQQIVLGRSRVGGVQLAPGWTFGTNSENWVVPVAFAGHQVEAIDDIFFGEDSIGTLDAGYYVQAGSKYFKSRPEARVANTAGGAISATYTVPGGAATSEVQSIAYIDETLLGPGDGYSGGTGGAQYLATTLVVGVDYSVALVGSNRVVTWLTTQTGRDLVVTYLVEVGTAHARARPFLGLPAGERDTDLEGWSGGEWTATDLGKEMARVHFTFLYDPDIYPSGAPSQLSVVIRGVRAYDPRLDSTNGGSGAHRFATPSTWAWTDNSALLWAWYMASPLGMGATVSEINWPSVITAANVCDELVPVDAGAGTQKRYTCNGVLSTADDRRINVNKILSSMVGTRFLSGGQWYVRAGAYVSPALDLTDNDFGTGGIKILPRVKRRDLFNAIRGLFVDARPPGTLDATDVGGLWALTDFPQYESATYITQDGGETLWEDIELPLTDDWRRATRISKLMLFRSRQALTIAASWKLKAYKLQPGDTCRITSVPNGWTNKVFRVIDRQYQPHGDISLILQEEASAVYAWDYSEVSDPDPAPNTSLPDPRVISPLGDFALSAGSTYTLPDGSIVPYCEVTWAAITDSAVLSGGRIEVWWKRSVDQVFRRTEVSASTTSMRIEPVSGGDVINVFGWAVNGSQVRSTAVFATRRLSADLPAGVVVPALSANLIPNASFERNANRWTAYVNVAGTATVEREPQYTFLGVPSNARLTILNATASTNNGAIAYTEPMTIDAGREYIGYADLIPWACDAAVVVEWLDQNQQTVGANANGNIVPGVSPPGVVAPGGISTYVRSRVVAVPPAGARYARLWVGAFGTWTAPVFGGRYVFFTQPFFGSRPAGALQDPPWDAGTSLVLGTSGIQQGATFEVSRASIPGVHALSTITASPLSVIVNSNLSGVDVKVRVAFDLTAGPYAASAALAYAFGQISWNAGFGSFFGAPDVLGAPRIILRETLAAGAEKTVHLQVESEFTIPAGTASPVRFYFRTQLKGVVPMSMSGVEMSVEILKV